MVFLVCKKHQYTIDFTPGAGAILVVRREGTPFTTENPTMNYCEHCGAAIDPDYHLCADCQAAEQEAERKRHD